MISARLKETITNHEASKRYAYKDSLGYLTIGIGRNIDTRGGRGLSADEIEYLLMNDINLCESQLHNKKYYSNQDAVRKEVLIELCFNLGIDKLEKFVNTLKSFEAKDYESVVNGLKNSLWYSQVGKGRSSNIFSRILTGNYP